MADTDTPDLDMKLPDGTVFKGNLQDAASALGSPALPGSMAGDVSRIAADVARNTPPSDAMTQKMTDY